MPRICSICPHAERKRIDAAIVEGVPNRRIATQYSVSEAAVRRHKDGHLPATLVKAQAATDVRHALDVVGQLKAINSVCMSVLKDARDQGDGDLALKAVDRILRQLEMQAKMIGQLDERPTINIIGSLEFVAISTTLTAALADFPDARGAVARALLTLEGGHEHRD